MVTSVVWVAISVSHRCRSWSFSISLFQLVMVRAKVTEFTLKHLAHTPRMFSSIVTRRRMSFPTCPCSWLDTPWYVHDIEYEKFKKFNFVCLSSRFTSGLFFRNHWKKLKGFSCEKIFCCIVLLESESKWFFYGSFSSFSFLSIWCSVFYMYTSFESLFPAGWCYSCDMWIRKTQILWGYCVNSCCHYCQSRGLVAFQGRWSVVI